MLVKNKKSGETETLRYGAAMDAVAAGTHALVNVDEAGEAKAEKPKAAAKSADKPAEK